MRTCFGATRHGGALWRRFPRGRVETARNRLEIVLEVSHLEHRRTRVARARQQRAARVGVTLLRRRPEATPRGVRAAFLETA